MKQNNHLHELEELLIQADQKIRTLSNLSQHMKEGNSEEVFRKNAEIKAEIKRLHDAWQEKYFLFYQVRQ